MANFVHHRLRLLSVSARSYRSMSTVMSEPNLQEYWMPFTHNRNFKSAEKPKMFHKAEGIHYYLADGTQVLDGVAGLWCCNAGHKQVKINEAIKNQLDKLDFASSFNTSHELPFEFSRKILELLPGHNFGQVFFTMCGSTAVDTAMKIALAYHRANGEAGRVRFVGRERGYHGVGFGGISVGGIGPNKKAFSGASLPFVDHLPHTHSLKDMAFSKGLPHWGGHLADELERIIALHDASSIAAVIVEPVAGSTGVLPPPVGYLKRLKDICNKHGILLIFDEVITGFGRLGASFAAEKFNVSPDMITCAKGLTNGVIPAGAVICRNGLYSTLMDSADREGKGSHIEFFHGYTYSGHPLAMAAGIATLEIYKEQDLFQRANDLAPYFQDALHSLKGLPHVIDIRDCGLMGAVELSPVLNLPTKRAADIFNRCFEKGVFVRPTGSTIAMSPPLIFERKDIDRLVGTLAESIVESSSMMTA